MSRSVVSGRNPSVSSNGGCTRVTHSEFFSSVVSTSTDYAVTGFALNPGVASVFPWLSQVAQRYETYKFRRLAFELHTRAASTQVGTVGLVFDFDAQDSAPQNQMEALRYHDKSADSPWKDQKFSLDLVQGDRLPIRYTRSGLPTTPYDIKTLDLGNLFVFTDGVAASANIGLLEVCYTVDLFTPQCQNGIGGTYLGGGTLNATHLIGTAPTSDPEALFPFTAGSSATLVFNQIFEGLFGFQIYGTVLSADYAPNVLGAGSAATVISQTVNAAATQVNGVVRISATPGCIMTPTITATTVTGSNSEWGRAGYNQFA
jgi:hypothetical protein